MAVIAVANSKGGTGKTTIVRELAHHLAGQARVLMIDLDPQASLSKSVNLPTPPPYSMAQVFQRSKRLKDVVADVADGLAIATGGRELNGVEVDLRRHVAGHFVLARAIEGVRGEFDYVVVDTVGATGELIANALVAADALIIPLRPEATDLNALPEFLELVEEVNQIPTVKLAKVALLPTQFVANSLPHQEAVAALRQLGYKVLPPIGRTTQASAAAFKQQSLEEWNRRNPRVAEYAELVKEVRAWLRS